MERNMRLSSELREKILHPSLDDLLERVPRASRFALIMAAAKRARKIVTDKTMLSTNYRTIKPFERALEEILQGYIDVKLPDKVEYTPLEELFLKDML